MLCAVVLQVLPGQFQRGMVGPCPDNAVVCNSLSCNESCTVGGTCASGKCYCNLQYTGPECAKKLTPSGNYTTYVPVVDDGSGRFSNYDSGYLMVSCSCCGRGWWCFWYLLCATGCMSGCMTTPAAG